MQIVVTAVGPDNVRLADPIIHYLTGQGANIAEIQMYDHDEEALFAMMVRVHLPAAKLRYLADAGHYVLEDAADEVIPLIADFIRSSHP